MNNTSRLPKIGSLVRLRPYVKGMDFVKVEAISEGGATRDFPPGTIAMVVEHAEHPDDSTRVVPLLLVDNFTGWVFDDEWTYVRSRKGAS